MALWDTLASTMGLTTTSPRTPIPLSSPWADNSRLADIVLSDVYGTNVPDRPLTRETALSIPPLLRARIVLSTLGRVPMVVVDRTTREELTGPHEAKQLISQLDPETTNHRTIVWTVDDLLFYGVSWWVVTSRYVQSGKPSALRRLKPGSVDLSDPKRPMVSGHPVQPEDLIRIDGPTEGLLALCSVPLRAAMDVERAYATYAADPVPAVELHQTAGTPLSNDEIDNLIRRWSKARRSANGGVSYTSAAVEAKVHGAPAENLLVDGRNASALSIAQMVGIPADAIDASAPKASMTYANLETRNRALIDYGLANYAECISARLSMPDITASTVGITWDWSVLTTPSDSQPGTSAPEKPKEATPNA